MTLSGGSSFVAAAGGVTGREHRRAHRDGQDGFALVATPRVTAAIVTDGCSSGRTSEVGARLGARWIAELVDARVRAGDSMRERAAEVVTTALVDQLGETARSLSPRGRDRARRRRRDVALRLSRRRRRRRDTAIVFGVGDGIAWVDGKTTSIDPGPENAPIYPAYALLGATIEPRILHVGSCVDAVQALAVATDGAAELLGTPEDPATTELDAIVRDERLLANPSLLRKRLIVLSDRGRFWDDVTIGIVRRDWAS